MQDTEFKAFLENLTRNADKVPAEKLIEVHKALEQIRIMEELERARTDFLTFVRLVGTPDIKFSSYGQHHKMAEIFSRILSGDLKRVTISMPPRYGKSQFGSIYLPAWHIGRHPSKKVMQISAKEDLATDFGRKVKSIIDSPIYQRIFPGVKLSRDSKSSGKFAIDGHGGEYFALGLTSAQAGKGGDLIVCLPHHAPVYGLFRKYSIGEIFDKRLRPFVITRGKLGLPQIRRVKGSCRNKSNRLTTINTLSGKSIECTPTHSFFLEGRGMTRAEAMVSGDALVSLRFPIMTSFLAPILTALISPLRLLRKKEFRSEKEREYTKQWRLRNKARISEYNKQYNAQRSLEEGCDWQSKRMQEWRGSLSPEQLEEQAAKNRESGGRCSACNQNG